MKAAPRCFVWVFIDNEFSMLRQNTPDMLAKIANTISGDYGRPVSELAYMSNSYVIPQAIYCKNCIAIF